MRGPAAGHRGSRDSTQVTRLPNPCPPLQSLVTCVGQPLGIVAAETEEQARAAAAAVVVEYEDLPAVLDIEDAIAGKLYIVVFFPVVGLLRVEKQWLNMKTCPRFWTLRTRSQASFLSRKATWVGGTACLPACAPCFAFTLIFPHCAPLLGAAGSYYDGWGHSLASGDVEAAFGLPDCECVLEGETKMGGQVGAWTNCHC